MPDVLGPGLRCVFCGINPGRFSAAAAAHFANPRNDFWRLLRAAGFTPRLYEPTEQFALLDLGLGVTNAACRTTPGSSDLRRSDFAGSAERLESLARELVEEPARVEVFEHPEPGGVRFEVRVAPDDVGRLVGRGGRTVRAIRNLLAAASEIDRTRYFVDVAG